MLTLVKQHMPLSSSLASRVPADILCEMFLFLGDIYPPSRYDKYGCICQVTHVCKKWREAGLGLADLWAGIACAFPSQDATDIILARARNAPLIFREDERLPHAVCSNDEFSVTPYQLSLVAEHVLRLHTLVYTGAHDWSNGL